MSWRTCPNLNDFVRGFAVLLPPDGVITVEFPHLLRLIRQNQFDTIYHEHFSYFSLHVVQRVFAQQGLRVFDVTELPTHGGSLRVFACHNANTRHARQPAVDSVLGDETRAGLNALEAYRRFGAQIIRIKCDLLDFCIRAQRAGKAHRRLWRAGERQHAAELLRHRAGVPAVHRRSQPAQAGHAAARHAHSDPSRRTRSSRTRPDYVLILPWNLRDEIMQQMERISAWGGRSSCRSPASLFCNAFPADGDRRAAADRAGAA